MMMNLRMPLLVSALAVMVMAEPAHANKLAFNVYPKTHYDEATKVKSFTWNHTQRFLSSGYPVVSYRAQAKPQELVTPTFLLIFYRNAVTFEHCNDIEWQIDGRRVEPLAYAYDKKSQLQVKTETLRFAFDWNDLEDIANNKEAKVRICNEHFPIVDAEKRALRKMLDALLLHTTDMNPARTEQTFVY